MEHTNLLTLFLISALISIFFYNNAEALDAEGVIGGLPANPGEFKYVVSLQQQDRPVCTGSIIGKKYILTAAHCVVLEDTNAFEYGRFKIVAVTNDLNANDSSRVEVPVTKTYVPDVYNSFRWDTGLPEGDVAVLELENELDFEHNDNMQELAVDNRDPDDDSLYSNIPTTFAGFGFDNIELIEFKDGTKLIDGSSSHRLQKAKVLLIDQAGCRKDNPPVKLNNLCARVVNYDDGTPQGACTGDSGGPLVDENNVIVAVLSASPRICNDNRRPSIYTKVASYAKFIENVKKGITKDMRVNTAKDGVMFP